MANIKLYELPDAGIVADNDYLHLSQASSDFKITISDLANKFGEVDIYGLTENASPVGADYLPTVDVSVGIDIASNRKVTLDSVSTLFQTSTYFSEQTSVALEDTVVFRQDGNSTQNEVGVDVLRDRINDFSVLTTGTDATIAESDILNVYGVSTLDNKKFSISNMRAKMFDITNVNTAPSVASGDFLYFYDISNTSEGKISYTDLKDQIAFDVIPTNLVTTNTAQTITGFKTFPNGLSVGSYSLPSTLTNLETNIATAQSAASAAQSTANTAVSAASAAQSTADSNAVIADSRWLYNQTSVTTVPNQRLRIFKDLGNGGYDPTPKYDVIRSGKIYQEIHQGAASAGTTNNLVRTYRTSFSTGGLGGVLDGDSTYYVFFNHYAGVNFASSSLSSGSYSTSAAQNNVSLVLKFGWNGNESFSWFETNTLNFTPDGNSMYFLIDLQSIPDDAIGALAFSLQTTF